MPSFVCRAFQVPKDGSRPDECEDAFALNLERGRLAVADGASESFAASEWAGLLVRAFVDESDDARWLTRARNDWRRFASAYQDPSWFDQMKLDEGAFAAFLGLEVFAGGTWQAEGVGDTCLFQLRGDCLLRSFPMLRSSDFTNQPDLICSKACRGEQNPLGLVGDWQENDMIYVATDALAAWFLRLHEQGRRPWHELESIQDSPGFVDYIRRERASKAMRNDDVTLLRVELAAHDLADVAGL